MNKTIVIALLAATVAMPFVTAGSTGACDSGGAPALGEVEISPTNDPTQTFYIDDRNYALGNGLWIYQEANGEFTGGDVTKDLQRGGTSAIVPDDTDICNDNSPNGADTLIV